MTKQRFSTQTAAKCDRISCGFCLFMVIYTRVSVHIKRNALLKSSGRYRTLGACDFCGCFSARLRLCGMPETSVD